MTISRRSFLAASGAMIGAGAALRTGRAVTVTSREPSFDPWLEIDRAALAHNAREAARLAGGRPVLGVIKNNGYGLGVEGVGSILDRVDEIAGLAVVKASAALALREAGVRKPVLLLSRVDESTAAELVAREIRLAPFGEDAHGLLARLAGRFGRPVPIHLYIDTGMNRVGVPFRAAPDWIARLAREGNASVEGTFMGFTEEDDFDPIQLDRFVALASGTRDRGIDLGRLHAASSHGLFFRPDARLDMVRPGLVLFGAYPAGARELDAARLRPAFRLKARVVRVERLEAGDSVSYGRNYVAQRPVWVATLPVGHADGYPRRAVDGCEVLIGGRVYPVIGAVSASHTIVELGDEPKVSVGDEATLLGPDHPAIHPNEVAARAGISVYDVLMHLSAGLPRRTV